MREDWSDLEREVFWRALGIEICRGCSRLSFFGYSCLTSCKASHLVAVLWHTVRHHWPPSTRAEFFYKRHVCIDNAMTVAWPPLPFGNPMDFYSRHDQRKVCVSFETVDVPGRALRIPPATDFSLFPSIILLKIDSFLNSSFERLLCTHESTWNL